MKKHIFFICTIGICLAGLIYADSLVNPTLSSNGGGGGGTTNSQSGFALTNRPTAAGIPAGQGTIFTWPDFLANTMSSTNSTLTSPTFVGQVTNNATNIFSGVQQVISDGLITSNVCTVTAPIHTSFWTVASGTMPYDGNSNIGLVFILNGTDQYTIAYQQNATQFYTTTPANSNFVAASPIFYGVPIQYRDVSSVPGYIRGAIDSGGCLHVTSDAFISGIFIHDAVNGNTNGWTIGETIFEGKPALGLFSWWKNDCSVQISEQAPFNSFCIGTNGDTVIRGALVNDNADLVIGGTPNSATTNIQLRGFTRGGGATFSNSVSVAADLSVGGTKWNSANAGLTNTLNGGVLDPNSTLTVSNVVTTTGKTIAVDVAGNGSGLGTTGNGLAIYQGTVIIATINNNGSPGGTPSIRLEGNVAHSEIYNQFPGQWDFGDATKPFGSAYLQTSLVMGAGTNTPSFTLVNTNWISGKLYTNQTGRPIQVIMPCQITMTGVAGNSTFALVVTGVTTNTLSMNTLVTSLATSLTNQVSAWVAAGGTFTPTNLSSGAGDSGAPINGGQYMVY